MIRSGSRRAAQQMTGSGSAEVDWWTWLDGSYTVVAAYDFRDALSLADATKIGDTPAIVQQPGGGLNITSEGLVCAGDTVLSTGAVCLSTSWSMVAGYKDYNQVLTTKVLSGAYTSAGGLRSFQMGPYYNATLGTFIGHCTDYTSLKPVTSATGTIGVSGLSSYAQGVNVDTLASGSISGLAIYLGAQNLDGTQNAQCTSKIACACITSDTISEPDMATLHTLMAVS